MLRKIKTALKSVYSSRFFDIFLILILMTLSILPRACSFNLSHIKEENRAEYMDDSGMIWMNDPDSFYFARIAREMSENGDYYLSRPAADDSLMFRFKDGSLTASFLPAVSAFFYRLLSPIFGFSFYSFICFIGPFLYSLSVIPAYIFIKRRTSSRLGAFVAGFFAGTTIIFLRRTVFCSFDTDILLFVLPMSFITCFSEIFFSKTKNSRIFYSFLSVFFFFLLASTWATYSIYFFLALGISIVYAALLFIKTRNKNSLVSNSGLKFSIFSLLACFLLVAFTRGSFDFSIFATISDVLGTGYSSGSTKWPSAGKYVSELRDVPFVSGSIDSVSPTGIVNCLGGIFPLVCLVALIAFYVFEYICILRKKRTFLSENELFPEISVLLPWLFMGFVSLIGGIRFLELPSLPVSLALGLFIGHLRNYSRDISSFVRVPLLLTFSLAIIAPQAVALTPAHEKYTTAIDDTLIEVSEFIGEEAGENKENSLIISWWDYGYTYEYFSGVRTLADGGTYNGEIYCYLSSIFLSSVEKDSEKALNYLLERADLHPDTIYLVASNKMVQAREAMLYYADWISKDYNVYYESSFLKRMVEEEKDVADYEFVKSFDDPLGRHTSHIYKYTPKNS